MSARAQNLPLWGRWLSEAKSDAVVPAFPPEKASFPRFFRCNLPCQLNQAVSQILLDHHRLLPLDEQYAAALAARRPVFINFTAKWCLVCLLNDKTSLSTETFRRLAAEKNIALFKADWTNRDETIRDALKAYDRNSIPLYIWYPAGKQTPVLLPQILTPDILKTQLQ